jgi:hypothetical protein
MIFIFLFSIVLVSLATKISYRNYRASDANEVAKLCCDVFDGPFQPYDILAKNLVINNHKKQLEDRYNDKVNGAVSHAMIVGTPTHSPTRSPTRSPTHSLTQVQQMIMKLFHF